ncbi:hypothetical protein BDD12DRAFT_896877 [Trichophaea hybrida]|nr:hypothetical protein BDD12DRAFT_896877 [Trichophaea hybrida]
MPTTKKNKIQQQNEALRVEVERLRGVEVELAAANATIHRMDNEIMYLRSVQQHEPDTPRLHSVETELEELKKDIATMRNELQDLRKLFAAITTGEHPMAAGIEAIQRSGAKKMPTEIVDASATSATAITSTPPIASVSTTLSSSTTPEIVGGIAAVTQATAASVASGVASSVATATVTSVATSEGLQRFSCW